MAGSSIVKYAAFAGAGYLAYRYLLPNGFSLPSSAPPSQTPATAAPDPNAIVGANTADGIFAKLQAATSGKGSLGIDQWNWYLASVAPQLGALPDPFPIFSAATPGFDRAQSITAAQYWNVMAPYLKAHNGMSGLGYYAGLGALARGIW